MMERMWKLYQKFVELDKLQTNPRGADGNELDAFWSAKFIEDTEEDGAMTATERKAALKTIDVDSNGMMSLIEYLLWKFKKTPAAVVKLPQGDNKEELAAAMAALQEVEDALQQLLPKVEASKKATAAAKTAEEQAVKAEKTAKDSEAVAKAEEAKAAKSSKEAKEAADEVKRAEDELQAVVNDIERQEKERADKIASCDKVAKDESISAVKRGKAVSEREALLAEDPMPLRKAKILQAAAVKKVTKVREKLDAKAAEAKAEADKASAAAADAQAAREAAEEQRAQAAQAKQEAEEAQSALEAAQADLEVKSDEARRLVEEVKAKGGPTHGAYWFMEREMFETDKSLSRSKQKYDHSKPFKYVPA